MQVCIQNFSIRQSFKDTEELNMQNSNLRAHETGRNFLLKFGGVYFSPVFGVRYTHLQCPAIVCQHT